MTITFVTGNKDKLNELMQLLDGKIELASIDIDLPEIQSMDLEAIVKDKAKRAFEVVQGPVIVEDVSAGLDDFGGLPGPFYKFFRQELGDAVLLMLAEAAGSNRITLTCTAAYYDGNALVLGIGIVNGQIVEPKGTNGFGFDPFILPDGQDRTMAELLTEEKLKISHRSLALEDLIGKLPS